jgi:monoamine oxidase
MVNELLTGGSTKRPDGQDIYNAEGVLGGSGDNNNTVGDYFYATRDNSSAFLLDSPVRRIEYDNDDPNGMIRVVSDRVIATAKHVVVAMPPTMVRTIEFVPPLPPGRIQLNDRMPMGATAKTFTFYNRPFWRDDGLTGQAISDFSGRDSGLIEVTYDLTDDTDDSGNQPGIMMGFINGKKARDIDTLSTAVDDEFDPDSKLYQTVRSETIKSLVKFFGDKAKNYQGFTFNRWNDEVWSRGGPVAVPLPGVITQYWESHLTTSVGGDRIHWAGTETSEFWTGYMDGAIRAGYRVATEVMQGTI